MSNAADEPSIRELRLLTQQNICKLLDVKNEGVSGNFKTLAAEVGMSINDLDLVSQGSSPTHSVLSWWGRSRESTIPKLREILVSMGRWDCVGILDQDPKAVKPQNETMIKTEKDKTDGRKKREKEMEIGELSPSVYDELCEKLNEKLSGRDYIELASRMKYTSDDLKRFEKRNPENPTDEILQKWRTKDGHNVDKLVKILRKIERDDLAALLEKEYYKNDDLSSEDES